MVVIKQLSALIILVVVLSAFAGCGTPDYESNTSVQATSAPAVQHTAPPSDAGLKLDPSVRYLKTGDVLKVGMMKSDTTKVTGDDEADGLEFADGVERLAYWDAPGIMVDFLEDKVTAFRLMAAPDWAEANDIWETMDGIYPGMSKEEVYGVYEHIPEDMKSIGEKGGIMIQYDENFDIMTYDGEADAPYIMRITLDDEGAAVDIVAIQSFVAYEEEAQAESAKAA